MFGLNSLLTRLAVPAGNAHARGGPGTRAELPPVDAEAAGRAPVPLGWAIAVWVVSAAWVVLQLPYGYGLASYLYYDSGWALSTDALLSEGLVPTQDFAYFYGLLTLLIDRAWFAVFGATPFAQAGLSLVSTAAATHATIRFARAVRLRRSARWLLLVCAPLAIMPSFYHTPTHALEYALLINAVALQAAGRPATALVLATICLFVKPAMAGVYGPILAGIILFGPRTTEARFGQRVRDLLPAAGICMAVAGLLAARFGTGPLLATLVPTDAAKVYAADRFGFFFGIGRQFRTPLPGGTARTPRPGSGSWPRSYCFSAPSGPPASAADRAPRRS
jgi:hypothetical protein